MSKSFALPPLPAALNEIDLSELSRLDPGELILQPALAPEGPSAAGKALAYSRRGAELSYDAIGFRFFAASARRGVAPLQTRRRSTLEQRLRERQATAPLVDEILAQQPKLRHRPLFLPLELENDRFRYTIDRDTLHLYTPRAEGSDVEVRWTFSLTDLPAIFLKGAVARDERAILAQERLVLLEATHWLPLSVLITEGCFRRFQDIRERLEKTTRKVCFYCFLSHRWLDPKHPDPAGMQAQFAAWQLIFHLIEAIRVAQQRGLHEPRRFSSMLGTAIGPRAGTLAESLIVSVLRNALDADTLSLAAGEVESIEIEMEDSPIAHAARDAELRELNALVAQRPILQRLLGRIYIWYDYTCLPQPPRVGDETKLFRTGLKELVAAQIIGRTAIMLDNAEDYLSRAWCTLEALTADNIGGATDLLVGPASVTAHVAVEHHFEMLLADEPHVLWRALLDTEFFQVQTAATCMARLDLAATEPADLPFIYERLKSIPAPTKIHIDDSEVVTGCMALPAFQAGSLMLRARDAGRVMQADRLTAENTTTLDWSAALSLPTSPPPGGERGNSFPSFYQVSDDPPPGLDPCHVAVVGACEGEAMLLAQWTYDHRHELEPLLNISVISMSWVATDIAPVGHFAVGTLTAVPVVAETWVVVTMMMRLEACGVTRLLTETLRCADIACATIAIDAVGNNVRLQAARDPNDPRKIEELLVAVDVKEDPPKTHVGGLYRWQLETLL